MYNATIPTSHFSIIPNHTLKGCLPMGRFATMNATVLLKCDEVKIVKL